MPKLELRAGAAAKSWELQTDGRRLFVRWGTIGRAPTSSVRTFADAEGCRAEFRRLLAERRAKGWVPARGERGGAALEEPRNDALEGAIRARPDDAEARAVYGDWLSSAGHPRGELCALPRDPAGDASARLHDLLSRHELALLGPLAERLGDELWLELDRGFAERLWLQLTEVSEERAKDTLEVALSHPVTRMLRALRVEGGFASLPVRALLGALGAHGTSGLEDLFLAWGQPDDELALEELLAVCPSLTTVRVVGPTTLFSGDASRLTRLTLGGRGTKRPDLNALFAGRSTPALRELGLCLVEPSAELIEQLAASPLLRQLERLDLSETDWWSPAIATLRARWPAFVHLSAVQLRAGWMSDDDLDALRAHPNVVVSE